MGKCFSNWVEESLLGILRGSSGSALWYGVYLPLGYLVRLGYCPIATFISVVREATLLKYGLWLDVILFDNKLRTQISAFLEELMLNCCKHIKIHTDKTNKLIQFCFP